MKHLPKITKITRITNYAWKNFNTQSPGTNDVYNIYCNELGELSHTMHSFEYRGYHQSHLITIALLNERAPYSKYQVRAQIVFQEDKLDNITEISKFQKGTFE